MKIKFAKKILLSLILIFTSLNSSAFGYTKNVEPVVLSCKIEKLGTAIVTWDKNKGVPQVWALSKTADKIPNLTDSIPGKYVNLGYYPIYYPIDKFSNPSVYLINGSVTSNLRSCDLVL